MFYVHEIHALDAAHGDVFETMLHEKWGPALAAEPGMRLVWCVRSMPGTASYPELITMTAVEDGAALERLGARCRSGDLRELGSELGRHRNDVTTRVLAALEEFNPYSVELDEMPMVHDGVPSEMYIHDFVAPQPGMQRIYEVQIREAFMKMLEMDALADEDVGRIRDHCRRWPRAAEPHGHVDRERPGDLEPARPGEPPSRTGAGFVDERGPQAAATRGSPASFAAWHGRRPADGRPLSARDIASVEH